MRFLRGVLFLGALTYGLAAIAAYTGQGKLLYAPDDRELADCNLPVGTEFWTQNTERGILSANKNDNLLLFFHGNAGSACNWRYLGVNHVGQLGYDVLVLEYPGYGGDARTPGKSVIEDSLSVLSTWVETQPYQNVSVMGYSLGTGVASLYAQHYGAEQVILFAPFDSIYNVALKQGFVFPRFLLREDFDNMIALENLTVPISIVHGEADVVIAAEHSYNLSQHLLALGGDVEREVRAGAGHYGLFESPGFDQFLRQTLHP